MIDAEPLLFSRIRDAYPERWEKARPGNALVNPHDEIDGRFAVRREGGQWHECVLAVAHEEFVGTCDCDGFQFHEGACSHLCAVYRLYADDGADAWPKVQPAGYQVELRSDEQDRAAADAEPERRTATDGGHRV